MEKQIFRFELGQDVEDSITGFCGTVTGRCESIGYGIEYRLEKTSKGDVKTKWFHNDRLRLVK